MFNPLTRLQHKLQLKRDYIETFSSPHGQRVLADILAHAGVTRPRFNADVSITQFYEGHRHLAMSIYRQVHSSVEVLTDLIAEETKHADERQRDQNQ